MIFYEAPHRIEDCLKDLGQVFGEAHNAVLAREITKTFETVVNGSLAELQAFVAGDSNQRKGEMVVLIEGVKSDPQSLDPEAERIMEILLRDLSVKQASALGAEITGVKKKLLYQWALDNS